MMLSQGSTQVGGQPTTPFHCLENAGRAWILSNHDHELVVRPLQRDHVLTLVGPEAGSLLAPVPARVLHKAVSATMHWWGREILAGEYPGVNGWASFFAVLSTCRMLHTLHTARITPKPAAARWAQATLDSRWVDLIQRAWDDRPNPGVKVRQPADPDDVERTLGFIKYALVVGREYRDT